MGHAISGRFGGLETDMVIPVSYEMTVETPREALEDACERLRRTVMDSGCALDLAEALQELTALRVLDQ